MARSNICVVRAASLVRMLKLNVKRGVSNHRLTSADPDDQSKLTEDTRQLGLVVCRGTSVVLICPQDGMESIPNPFVQQQDG